MTTRMAVLTVMLLAAAAGRRRRGPGPGATGRDAAGRGRPGARSRRRGRAQRARHEGAAAGDLRAIPAVGRPGAAARPVAAEPTRLPGAVSDPGRPFCRSTPRSRTTRCSFSAGIGGGRAVLRQRVGGVANAVENIFIGLEVADRRHVRHRHARVAGPRPRSTTAAGCARRRSRPTRTPRSSIGSRRTRICSPTCSRRPASAS